MPDIVSIAVLGHVQAPLAAGLSLVAAGAFGLFHLYLVFLILGLIYAVFMFFTSSLGGDHDLSTGHDVDVGHDLDVGHDVDAGHDIGHDAGQGAEHGELGVADGSMTHLGPFSPMIVAMFFTCFGLSGVILTKPIPFGWLSLLPSLAVGAVGAWASMSAFNKLFAATEASSEAEAWRLVGQEAMVITPIPPNGIGEIQYVAKGSTFSAPARSTDGKPVARATRVTITDSSKAIFLVKKSVEERFRDLERST
jgi:membrane protein implicated in regulation of membrane protease activity